MSSQFGFVGAIVRQNVGAFLPLRECLRLQTRTLSKLGFVGAIGRRNAEGVPTASGVPAIANPHAF